MKNFLLSCVLGMSMVIPLSALAQSSSSIAGFKLGSSEAEVAEILKSLKADGICNEVSSSYDFFSKKPRMSCRGEGMSFGMLSLNFSSITLEFNSKNDRLTDVKFWFGFPDASTRNHFELLVKDMEKVTSRKVAISTEEDKVGNKTRIARVKGSAFNITLIDDKTFGPEINFWKD
jgi:hypothetical protein